MEPQEEMERRIKKEPEIIIKQERTKKCTKRIKVSEKKKGNRRRPLKMRNGAKKMRQERLKKKTVGEKGKNERWGKGRGRGKKKKKTRRKIKVWRREPGGLYLIPRYKITCKLCF